MVRTFHWAHLFVIFPVLRNERCYKAAVSYQKVKVVPHGPDSPQAAYTTLLTSYASSFVLQQIELSETVTYEFQQQDGTDAIYSVQTSEGTIGAKCFKMFVLLFLVYETTLSAQFPVVCETTLSAHFPVAGKVVYRCTMQILCAKRWTNNYYSSKHKYLKGTNRSDAENGIHGNDCSVGMSHRLVANLRWVVSTNMSLTYARKLQTLCLKHLKNTSKED